jgi:hypothetical protein
MPPVVLMRPGGRGFADLDSAASGKAVRVRWTIYSREAAAVPSGGSVAGAILFSQQIGQSKCP